jgi:peptide/nickel transport system substrate-binding protein
MEECMLSRTKIIIVALIGIMPGLGCAPAASSPGAEGAPVPRSAPTLKRITLATPREQGFRPNVTGPERVAFQMVHVGLTMQGEQRIRHPRLAEAVPSIENGLWKLLPDGRMETTWRLRDGARWHDGTPLTAEDLRFSLEVGRDREMSAFNSEVYTAIEEVTVPDPRTLVIAWKEPHIDADTVLGTWTGGVLPRHLLEDAYRSEKASFLDLPYWREGFVGAGPYRLRDWVLGGGLVLEANADYVLGRPLIDQIEVKTIPDVNTLSANLLAGTVDVTPNVGPIDLGIQLRDQWRGGTVVFNFGADSWVQLVPQFVDPQPGVVADVQLRRALAHAIDRQEIADTLMAGMSPVAHSILSPNQPAYREIEAAIPRYGYDPTRAAQLLEDRGYRKGADGIYRDQTSRRLELEVRSGPEELFAKASLTVADSWHRLGVDATSVRLSPQQFQDVPYVATFPAFTVFGGPSDADPLRSYHSSQSRLPGNNFRVPSPGNRSRYMNPEFDALLETYLKTVPLPERTRALGQVIHHMADQVTVIGLYYRSDPGAMSNRMLNVSREWPVAYITWNAHEWDVRS